MDWSCFGVSVAYACGRDRVLGTLVLLLERGAAFSQRLTRNGRNTEGVSYLRRIFEDLAIVSDHKKSAI
jgi:hypothetical protein